MSSQRSLILAERAVPRYTSFPTAPHFSESIGPQAAQDWLAGISPKARLSLYLHVPYCRSICHYCGCHTKAALKDEPLNAYARTLALEIEQLAELTPARAVHYIHWGGGTPGLLGPDRLRRLAQTLRARFDLSALREHAIELDPRFVDAPLADALAQIGVNRVSFGVQDINPHVQDAIGRLQPAAQVEVAIKLTRSAGIEAFNLDLMYGLPHQTNEDVRRTAQWAAAQSPGRLAIFGYAHVPWMKKHQALIDVAALPGAGERLAQAAAAREELEAAGYMAIGLDHFAKPSDPLAQAARAGGLRRNFQGYTTDDCDALLPLGVSSIGLLPQGYVQNAPDLGGWRRAVEAGRPPIVRGFALSPMDRARAAVIERLMCDFAVDFGAIARTRLGDENALDDAIAPLDALAHDGVVTRVERRVAVNPAARPFVRLAASCFDVYLQAQKARHSLAV